MLNLQRRSAPFINQGKNSLENRSFTLKHNEQKKLLKREVMCVFKKFGYLNNSADYEVRIKMTSGNIAWLNISSIETIK